MKLQRLVWVGFIGFIHLLQNINNIFLLVCLSYQKSVFDMSKIQIQKQITTYCSLFNCERHFLTVPSGG